MKITYRNKSYILKCYYCGELFHPFNGREKTSKYCSSVCMGKYRKGKPNGKRKTGKYIKCKMCNKKFYVKKCYLKDTKFCSKKCYWKSRKGMKLPQEWKRKIIENRKGYKHSEKTKRKISKAHIGKIQLSTMGINNPSWKGGITPLNHKIRTSSKFDEWRRNIFKRDDYTCQITKERGCVLHCHHIVPFKSILNEIRYAYSDGKITFERAMKYDFLWNTENGITLSKKLHKKHHRL